MTNRAVVTSLVFCLGVSFASLTGCAGGGSSSSGTTTTPPTTPTVTAPTVTSITPTSLPAGSAATAITVTGTGFTATTAVQVGGTVENTTYSSSTQISATVSAAQLLQGGLLPVIALNGDATSASGTAVNLTVNNPVPAITQLVPAALIAGGVARPISVEGTGFVPTTTIQVNGLARPTTFVTSTEVSVIFTAADLATGGTLNITAVNAPPGGGTSAAASAAVNNPVPLLNSLSPATVTTTTGAPSTITVNGTNFISSSVVQVGGMSVPTTFVSATRLTFQLTAAQQAAVNSFLITVTTPAPGGGISSHRELDVDAPVLTPVIQTVNPNQFIVGSPDTQMAIQIAGTSFLGDFSIQWNGTALANPVQTIYNTISYLYVTVPASLLAQTGTASITVTSPLSTPQTSNAVTVQITNPPAPTLTSISPNTGPINTAETLSLSGTGFTSASTVAFNGVTVPATYVGPGQLTLSVSAANLALPGNNSIAVTTPAPGGGTTAALVFTTYVALANNSVVYNPANGLFYASVPSSAGAPYGNSVVSIDPETGALGTPIPVGSEPNKLAISSDGTILWVSLDGASAVRQVNLTTGQAGMQFSLPQIPSYGQSVSVAAALAALPGAPNSVVVSTTYLDYGGALGIYDSGVLRGTGISSQNFNFTAPDALQVDGTKSELYTAVSGSYQTYTYGTSGLTRLVASSLPTNYAANEIQVAGGKLYTDFGEVFDAESGSLLGTLYNNGTTIAIGTTAVDTTLGKVFVLDGSSNNAFYPNQIQVFNLSDFTVNNASPIPISISTSNYGNLAETNLTRWGTNGLAFRIAEGLYSVRSNAVKDLSSTSADLSVALAATGTNATGSNATFTATVTNAGPSDASNVGLSALIPASGVLVSVTPSAGSCSTSNGVTCDLGGIANGASATVVFVVQETNAGSSTLTAQVSASENDPTTSNNSATSTVTVTGDTFNLPPTIKTIVPSTIQSGGADTTVTITGTGFTSGSTVQLGATALTTTYTNATTLIATVPKAQLTTLGWSPLTVSNPTPGGGTSAPVPLSVYSVIGLGANHILYDPYSRKIMASVGSDSTVVTGNSIVAVTPDTTTVGAPVPIGSQPTNLALSDDGQVLYTTLIGSESVARFNMLTQAADFTYTLPANSNYGSVALGNLAIQTGSENTVAIDPGVYPGTGVYDFNDSTHTVTERASSNGPGSGSCMAFLDSGDLISSSAYGNSTLSRYAITSTGFSTTSGSQFSTNLSHFGCFKLSRGVAYSNSGGVANAVPTTAVQLGVFPLPSGYGYGGSGNVEPDPGLNLTFFAVNSSANGGYSSYVDSIEAFDDTMYMPTGIVPIGFAAVEGTNATSFTVTDLVRWGQDGLALLTSTGNVYLLRGAAVVPGELTTGSAAAVLTSSSSASLTLGGGNVLLTLAGSNFLPGVAVEWNGSYRTTTIVDATHVTVAIPASDLASAGSASLTAVNPGATASNALTVTIN